MAVLDRHIEVLVVVDEHAVGVGENALAPGGEIIAVPVEDDQRVFAAVEEIHPVLGVGDDGRLSQLPSLGQLLPILDLLVRVLAIADGSHVVASSIALCTPRTGLLAALGPVTKLSRWTPWTAAMHSQSNGK